jgi:4-hydroxy-tetrahydrodipicolinate synthase
MFMNDLFEGLITALITPFREDILDVVALEKILKHQINNKVKTVIVAGSTGEGTSLTFEEYKALIASSLEIADKKIKLISSSSSSNTKLAVQMAVESEYLGVDGFMCSVPPYVKSTQEGIYQHFKAIHDATNLPIMLYSVPSRVVTDFTDETLLALSELPRILALKDAATDMGRPLRIKAKIKENFHFLAGDDITALGYNAQGGTGCVSIASNVVPSICRELQELCIKGDFASALSLHARLLPIYKALSLESNPIGVKYASSHLGHCLNEIRLPLTRALPDTQKAIRAALNFL